MNDRLMDVHGAGAQRSDPKSGNKQDYPQYFGPQGDVRCVRDISNDGKISKSEAKGKLKENFNKRDKNKDGYFAEDELTRKNQ